MPQETNPNRARAAMGMESPTAQQRGSQPSTSTEVDRVTNRIARTRQMELRFADAMPRGYEPSMLIGDAITAIRSVPLLAQCTEESFFGSLMTAAQLGLRPNVGSIGHGWVLPYKNKRKNVYEAQWILGYQGMVELAWRSNLVSGITAHTIFEGEKYRIAYGTEDVLEHEPVLGATKGRKPIAHYAVVRMVNGGRVWQVMSDEETVEIMSRSAAARDGRGPWIDDPLPMKRKSALRALWRFTPKSEAMSRAIETDETTRLVDVNGFPLLDDMPDVGAPGEPEPTEGRGTITVTRADQPAEAPVADPPAEPVQPKERRKQNDTAARRKALTVLEENFGPRAEEAVRLSLDEAHWAVPMDYLTLEELVTAAAFDMQAYDDAQLDAAAAQDGA